MGVRFRSEWPYFKYMLGPVVWIGGSQAFLSLELEAGLVATSAPLLFG